MKTTREKIEIMQAYERGEQIQIYVYTLNEWEDVETTPLWDWVNFDYRIKPKALESLIEPKFKTGDRIRHKLTGNVYKVSFVSLNGCGGGVYGVYDVYGFEKKFEKIIDIKEQGNYELLPNKFDITTLKPFDKVLVRTNKFDPIWTIDFYDGYRPKRGGSFTPFAVTGGNYFQQCIPYEGNEHLLGTEDDCDDFYKNWK